MEGGGARCQLLHRVVLRVSIFTNHACRLGKHSDIASSSGVAIHPSLRPISGLICDLGVLAIPPQAVPIAWTRHERSNGSVGRLRRSQVPEGDGKPGSEPHLRLEEKASGRSTRPQDLQPTHLQPDPCGRLAQDFSSPSPLLLLPLSSPDVRPLGQPAPNHPTVPGRDKSLISHPTLT
jgi:hypothetical protein